MSACCHRYDDPERHCTLPATPGNTVCIWHNHRLRKSDVYVALLLERVLTLIGDDLEGYQLSGLQWPRADLHGRCLKAADLRDAQLPGSSLADADLRASILRRANLQNADLRRADLTGADLQHVNLRGADLREACLREADLDHAVLIAADLRNADLTDARLDHFAWNRRTLFTGARGFEAGENEDDITQVFIAPLAMATRDSALVDEAHDPERDKTHYFVASSGSAEIELADAPPDAVINARPHAPVEPSKPAAPAVPQRVVRMPRFVYYVVAASLIVAFLCSGAAVWALGRLRNYEADLERQQPTITRPNQITTGDQALWQQRLADKDRQIQNLADELKQAREASSQHEARLAKLQADVEGHRLTIARMRTREDEAQGLALRFRELKREHLALLQQNQRLHDTARILNKGLKAVSDERDELKSFKQERLTQHFDRERLQETVDQLQQEKQTLLAKHENLQLINTNLQQRLGEAEQSLNSFLSRIEGSRLKEFLNDETDDEPMHPIIAGKPLVLGGDYLLTLRLDRGTRPDTVQSRLVIQRPTHKALPDVTLLLYDEQGAALRSMSYSFPASDGSSPFAAVESLITAPRFPAGVRVLINPALDPTLMAASP